MIKSYCVPVAVDARLISRDWDSPEGKFFMQCWGKVFENVTFMATAGGKRLEHGLSDWERLPQSERAPGAVRIEDVGRPASALLQPPPGTFVARVYIRSFVRDPHGQLDYERLMPLGGGHYESEPARDHLWLTRQEWQALVPVQPRARERFEVPEPIADRIVRYHFVVVPDCVTGWWAREAVRSRKMTVTVAKVGADELQLRLDGSVLLAAPGNVAVTAAIDLYDARLSGWLTYDRKKQVFSRFDLVAFGPARESNENRPRLNKTGRRWVGIAFELADLNNARVTDSVTAPYFLLRAGNDYFGPSR